MSTVPAPSAHEQLDYLGKLQRVLNEGRFVSSLKFATRRLMITRRR